MDWVEPLLHQMVPLTLLSEYLLKLGPDRIWDDQVAQANLWKGSRNEVCDLATWLSNRSHHRL